MITVDSSAPNPNVHEAVLFPFDNHTFPFVYYLKLGLVPGRKHPLNPVVRLGEPGSTDCQYINFYGTVLRIENELRMWYLGTDDQGRKRAHYAVSSDGIHWEKPELGLVKFSDNKKNNIVVRGPSGAGVYKDPHEKNPARR